MIRTLARKVATKRTKIFIGWNSGKYYHGDLMERAMALLLGLTGNWGKQGTGTRSWAISASTGSPSSRPRDARARTRRAEFQRQMISMRADDVARTTRP